MSIITRIILGFVVILGIGFYYVFNLVVADLKPQYRKLTEESLVDTARVLASLVASTSQEGNIDTKLVQKALGQVYEADFAATIYDFEKNKFELHVYITDAKGVVLFDSKHSSEVGRDYGNWRDVYLTLHGKYGARTSHFRSGESSYSVMYVAAPIVWNGELVGVLSVGKPTDITNAFVNDAKERVVVGTLVTLVASILIAILLTRMLTVPIARLSQYARDVRDGKRVSPPELGKSEIAELGKSFEEMRIALDGKKYIEKYVQTFTHEIKSPLAALQGALEILKEDPVPAQRERFINNMTIEVQRLKDIVERMLLLSTIEATTTIELSDILVANLLGELQESFAPLLEKKAIKLKILGNCAFTFRGEVFLIRQALANIIQNAIQFCPSNAEIVITIGEDAHQVTFIVEDSGPGIPAYARAKVFNRFFSLPRPDSGRKSSGLGLCLVREVADLHRGSVSVEASDLGGAKVQLSLSKG